MTDPDNPLLAELKQQAADHREKQTVVPASGPHPRDQACNDAGNELFAWLDDWRKRHELSGVEYVYILQQIQIHHLRATLTAERAGVR
jgi:hypothetical protein